jgi:hypothetical protein
MDQSDLAVQMEKIKSRNLPFPPKSLLSLFEGKKNGFFPFSEKHTIVLNFFFFFFAMTYFGATDVPICEWQSTFKIQEQVYHMIGSLEPAQDEEKKSFQIYSTENKQLQAKWRIDIFPVVYPVSMRLSFYVQELNR